MRARQRVGDAPGPGAHPRARAPGVGRVHRDRGRCRGEPCGPRCRCGRPGAPASCSTGPPRRSWTPGWRRPMTDAIEAVDRGDRPRQCRADDRLLVPGPEPPGPTRRRRVRPSHLPVRAVGFGQDLLPRPGPRAAPGRDQLAGDHPRPQLRLREDGPPPRATPTPPPSEATDGTGRPPTGSGCCGPTPPDGRPLRLRFAELEAACQAALLQLDPVADADEYAALLDVSEAGRGWHPAGGGASTTWSGWRTRGPAGWAGGRPTSGLDQLEIWEAGQGGSLVEMIADRTTGGAWWWISGRWGTGRPRGWWPTPSCPPCGGSGTAVNRCWW